MRKMGSQLCGLFLYIKGFKMAYLGNVLILVVAPAIGILMTKGEMKHAKMYALCFKAASNKPT